MAKGSTTSTVTNKQSPEQSKILQGEIARYMPDGTFVNKPTFDPAQHSWMGENRTAKFTDDQNAAFDATRATAFEHRPAIAAATQMAIDGAGPAGQHQGLGEGWSTDENGAANYADWQQPNPWDYGPAPDVGTYDAAAAARYASPYQEQVIDVGLDRLDRQNQIAQLRNNDAAAAASSFGGSRHGVVAARTNEGSQRVANEFLTDTLDRGYQTGRAQFNTDRDVTLNQFNADRDVDRSQYNLDRELSLSQFNRNRDEGQEALDWNRRLDEGNLSRLSSASDRVAQLAKTNQDLNGAGINALANVGDRIQGRDQQVLDTSYDELQNNFLWQAQLGQMLSGFTPAPSQTQTTSGGGSGSIWGSIGSAAASAAVPLLLSDETAKTDIEEADPEDGLKAIRALAKKGMFTYRYTDEAKDSVGAPDGKRTGFMAQDLEEVTGKPAPDAGGGFKGIDIAEHLGRLTHAVAALDKKLQKVA